MLGLLGIVFLIISISTLSSNPLPWYDETYMASLSKSFLEKGAFIKQVALYTDEPKIDLRFGPIYFLFTSLSFKIFGIGIFQYRIIAYLSGFFAIMGTVKLFRLYNKSTGFSIGLGMLLLFDPFYYRSMRDGRMDLMALGFILLSLYFLIKINKIQTQQRFRILNSALSGFFAVCAVLTTPRSGFLLIGIVIIWILFFLKNFKTHIKLFLVWVTPIMICYILWIIYAFGSFKEFYLFYLELSEKYTQTGNFYITIQKNQYILIPFSLLAFIVGVVKFRMNYLSELVIYSMISIVCFYFIVQDPGPYSVFILPFYYLLIFLFASKEISWLRETEVTN